MQFEAIETLYKEYLAADPDKSLSLGMLNKLDQLSDPSLDAHYKRIDETKALLSKIEKVKSNGFYQSLDLKLMALDLKQTLFKDTLTFNGKLQREQLPKGVDGISQGILQLFINDPRDPSLRLNNILSRLAQAPNYLKKEIETLHCPVKRWRDVEMQRAKELPELFTSILAWATGEGYTQLNELKQVIIETNKALETYDHALSTMQTTEFFAIGEEKVRELLALMEIERSPIELRNMAGDYLRDTDAIIESLRKRIVKKYDLPSDSSAASVQAYLNKKFRVTLHRNDIDSIVDIYKKQNNDLIEFVNSTNLFPPVENQKVEIIKTPKFLESVIPAGACWTPVPLRDGMKISLVYLTLKKDLIDEHTYLGIPLMMAHEGIPGHHLQFACAALQPSLVRKFFNASEHAEGWTTMLEDYLLDHGLIGDDMVDEARFMEKREIARLGARVGIDLYFMTADPEFLEMGYDLGARESDPFDNAGKLLKTVTGFSDCRVQAELNWNSTERGYPLCYLTGNRMVRELKKDLFAKNPKRLSEGELDREFHRLYLQSGCMPIASLREVFRHEGFL